MESKSKDSTNITKEVIVVDDVLAKTKSTDNVLGTQLNSTNSQLNSTNSQLNSTIPNIKRSESKTKVNLRLPSVTEMKMPFRSNDEIQVIKATSMARKMSVNDQDISVKTVGDITISVDGFGLLTTDSTSEVVKRFTLTNEKTQMEVQIISLGATVISIKVPDKNGVVEDIALGFESIEDYLKESNPNIGCTLGRDAFETLQDEHYNGLGNLNWVSSLDEKRASNHNSLYKHIFTINGDKSIQERTYRLSKFKAECVGGTTFDLRIPKEIGPIIARSQQNGFDKYYILTKGTEQSISYAARVIHPESGRTLELYTNQDGIQFYTSDYFPCNDFSDILVVDTNESSYDTASKHEPTSMSTSGRTDKSSHQGQPHVIKGKNGAEYGRHSAFCFNSLNLPWEERKSFQNNILNPGHNYNHRIIYKFGVLK